MWPILLAFLVLAIAIGVTFMVAGIVSVIRNRNPKTIHPDQVESDDPNMQKVIAEAWNTGKPVFGQVDDDGNFHMEVIEED